MADTKKLLDFQTLNLGNNHMSIIELKKSAKQGDQHAIRQLIEHYLPIPTVSSSKEKDRDPNQALRWVKKLVELGDFEARHRLADCYFSGQYVDKADSEKAIDLLNAVKISSPHLKINDFPHCYIYTFFKIYI